MALTNTYCLKMTPSQFGQSSVVVNCSQYDSLFRVIQFSLYNGINEFSIPDNCVVTIRGTKKDLTGFEYQCEYEGNVVTFPIQSQVTVLPGKVPAEIRVTSGNEIIGSWNFVFLVEESPLDENTIISETDLPLLEAALEASAQAESYKDLAEQSATEASASASEASDSATIATTKSEESNTYALKSEGYAVGEQNGVPVGSDSIYYENNAKYYSEHGGGGTHNYNDLLDKPSINDVTLEGNKTLEELGVPLKTSELTNDSGFISSIPSEYVTESELSDELDNYATLAQLATKADASSLSAVALSGSYNDLTNKPTIPSKTSQLTNDSNFVSDANYVHTDNNFTTTEKNKLSGIASGAEVNVQSDWNVTNTSSDAFIKNKPSIPSKTSDLTNDSGFITSVPVTSVNNKTGAVNLSASDVGALSTSTAYVSSVNGQSGAVTISVPTNTSDLVNDSGFLTSAVTTFNGQSGAVTYSAPVSSVNGQTGAVTGLQTTNNLVTSISSSSTDSQYPSAKCLYDLVGDIETLLASI